MVIYYYFSSNRISLNCKLPTIIKNSINGGEFYPPISRKRCLIAATG